MQASARQPNCGAIIVVEASETTTKTCHRQTFETNERAASIAVMPITLAIFVHLLLKYLPLTIFQQAPISGSLLVDWVVIMARHAENEKLALMAGPNGKFGAEKSTALGDSISIAIDIADALASGVAWPQKSLQKAWHEDANAIMIVAVAKAIFGNCG